MASLPTTTPDFGPAPRSLLFSDFGHRFLLPPLSSPSQRCCSFAPDFVDPADNVMDPRFRASVVGEACRYDPAAYGEGPNVRLLHIVEFEEEGTCGPRAFLLRSCPSWGDFSVTSWVVEFIKRTGIH
ncbi:hypothetical protein NL676_031017 [Syzygium grande]|nr:hypothetical protein NL676_031017 [Syzygium grande]